MLTALRARMPLDGLGWERLQGPRRLLFMTAAGSVRRRLSAPISGLVLAAARLSWLPLALMEAWTHSRRRDRRAPLWPVFVDCLMAGAWPGEAWVWRELFGDRIELGKRAQTLLLNVLGDPAGRALLADKAAAAEALRAAGAPVPETLAVIGPDSTEQALRPVRDATIGLVIKPRGGFGSRGLMMAEPLGGDRWLINGDQASWNDFVGRLRGAREPMLAQPRLHGSAALDGFRDAERPPVLRITTARRPGGAPFAHSALLAIPIPGASAGDFPTKDLRAPFNPTDGRLEAAVLVAKPRERLSTVPWNGAQIDGRVLEAAPAAVQATLIAAAAIPPLPVISWDVVLTDGGPVILEGNSISVWVLVNFWRTSGLNAGSLIPLLAEWASTAQTSGVAGA